MISTLPTEIEKLLHLHQQIELLMHHFKSIPDEAMNALVEASAAISDLLIEAPSTDKSDVAKKMRHATWMLEDDGGSYSTESELMQAIVGDLSAIRSRQVADDRELLAAHLRAA
jgi:hypothetical protein